MIAATCYGLPVHKSLKPVARAYPKYTKKLTYPHSAASFSRRPVMRPDVSRHSPGVVRPREACVTAITDIWAVALQDRPQPGGEQMTLKPHKANWTRAPQCMIIRSLGRRWLCRAVPPQ